MHRKEQVKVIHFIFMLRFTIAEDTKSVLSEVMKLKISAEQHLISGAAVQCVHFTSVA